MHQLSFVAAHDRQLLGCTQPRLLHEGSLLHCLLSGLHGQPDKPMQILNANEITSAEQQICEGEDA